MEIWEQAPFKIGVHILNLYSRLQKKLLYYITLLFVNVNSRIIFQEANHEKS